MPTTSAGILLFRNRNSQAEVFLVHPGGPFWAGRDLGAWSVPKGIVGPGEDELVGARREFREETGFDLSSEANARELGTFRNSGAKVIRVWAIEGDCDPAKLSSNSFEIEWPPKSGRRLQFPEIDRGGWFDLTEALRRITKGQRQIIEAFYRVR